MNDLELGRWTEERGNWSITQDELDQLAIIAVSNQPSKGYAWSLYRLLTGERLPVLRGMSIPEGLDFHSEKQKEYSSKEVYPNPATDELNIRLGNNVKIKIVDIYSIKGERVFSGEFDRSFAKIDISRLVSGVYIVTILKDDGSILNEKVIIE